MSGVLIAGLKDSNDVIRLNAVAALGEMGANASSAEAALSDRVELEMNEEVRTKAQEALAKIKGGK